MKRECLSGTIPIRVRWEETDTAGYVHNSVVFRWFEQGELEWFRHLGIHWCCFPEYGFPRIHVEADFRRPLTFDDHCLLHTKLVTVRGARFTLRHEVMLGDDLALHGQTTACCVSAADGRASLLPERMRTILENVLRQHSESPCE